MAEFDTHKALSALRKIAGKGCDFTRFGPDAVCRVHHPDVPEFWCPACIAADALGEET